MPSKGEGDVKEHSSQRKHCLEAWVSDPACRRLYQCLLSDLQVNSEAVQTACPVPFDEGRLWKGKDGPQLKRQLQQHFHNITRAMDCVGCEKCKLWGKLQLLGACLMQVLLSPSSTQCRRVPLRDSMPGVQALGNV